MIRAASLHYFSTLNKYSLLSHSSIGDYTKKCTRLVELEHVYASIFKTANSRDAFLANQFITACFRFSRLDFAVLMHNHMETSNAFVENAMIRGYAHFGYPHHALESYISMLRTEIMPTSYTFPPLISACTMLSAPDFGEAVHGQIWRNGFNSHLYVQTSLIDFYSKLGKIGDSTRVFDEMPERDCFAWTTMISAHIRAGDMLSAYSLFQRIPERNMATWNTMIDGYGRLGDVESAELLFGQMPCRDIISWTTIISCYSQNKKYVKALAVFKEMTMNGVNPDGMTLATVISACAHLGALGLGKEIHLYVSQNGFDLNVYMGSALIDMYAKCGSLERSLLVFLKLRHKNLFCWNSIIEGLSTHGHVEETLAMFNKMIKSSVEPNGVTFVSVLSACTHAGLVKEGRRWFQIMENDYSITPEIEHYGCMVDLLGRAGLLEEALDLIQNIRMKPNAVIWGALLSGCKLHKNLTIGRLAVNELVVTEPNNSGYYHLLLNMLAEESRWGEVKTTWRVMKELGIEKRCPGSSWIEMEGRIHQFLASDDSHAASAEIYWLLNKLNKQLKLVGYVPEL